jgi:hypothetical protein
MGYLEDNGIDEKKLDSICKRINKAARELEDMDLYIFGWSGSGCIIKADESSNNGHYVIRSLTANIDGGDPDYEPYPE